MSLKARMILTLVLAGAAVVFAAFAAPDYFHAVSAAKAAHVRPPTAPTGMMIASLLGLASWLSVVSVQWRNRQFGWVMASFLLSYLGVIAYAVLSLVRLNARPAAAGA
jgi:hypothetical protein